MAALTKAMLVQFAETRLAEAPSRGGNHIR